MDRWTKGRLAASCLFGVLAATSCDRLLDDDDHDEPSKLAIADAPAAFDAAYCERIVDCGCDAIYLPTPSECRTDLRQRLQELQAAGEENQLIYDPTCLAADVDWLDALDCGWVGDDDDHDDECVRPCAPYYGDRMAGQSCRTFGAGASNCAQGLSCDDRNYCDTGDCSFVCHDPCARADVGQHCREMPCVDGAACDYDADRCIAAPGPGEPCSEYGCSDDAVCNYDTNMCVALPVSGEPCVQGECAEDLFCANDPNDPAVQICMGRLANGEECTGHLQCESHNCPAGHCEPRPGEGEACAGVCDTGLECDSASEVCVRTEPAVCSIEPF
jgi:hypothetical protein